VPLFFLQILSKLDSKSPQVGVIIGPLKHIAEMRMRTSAQKRPLHQEFKIKIRSDLLEVFQRLLIIPIGLQNNDFFSCCLNSFNAKALSSQSSAEHNLCVPWRSLCLCVELPKV